MSSAGLPRQIQRSFAGAAVKRNPPGPMLPPSRKAGLVAIQGISASQPGERDIILAAPLSAQQRQKRELSVRGLV